MMKSRLMAAARADSIPEGSAGLWYIRRDTFEKKMLVTHCGKVKGIEPGTYTRLHCYTDSTLHNQGECVMTDDPQELVTHLDFMLRAKGDVLIVGLGLGCVIRGCLANPNVRSVTCIEKSRDVLKLVQPHMPKDRLTIIHADALVWCEQTDLKYDCAWTDIWTDTDRGEDHLAVAHQNIMISLIDKVGFQGAWQFPRYVRRILRNHGRFI